MPPRLTGSLVFVSILPGMNKLVEHLAHRYLIPWLLVPAFVAGLAWIVGADVFRPSPPATATDKLVIWIGFAVALAGTVATFAVLRLFWKRPKTWRLLELGRMSWIVLFALAWIAGVGFAVFLYPDLHP